MVRWYDCWNEPHLEPAWVSNYWANLGDRLFCYCDESRRAFRHWLERKYGNIEKLNATWGRGYREWLDVDPPNRHGTYPDWLDWGRFWYDQLEDHMRWRYEAIKAVDSSREVMSHSGAVPPFLGRANAFITTGNWRNQWIFGVPATPRRRTTGSSVSAPGTMDATRSAARDRAFWISEMSGGACNIKGFAKTPPPSPTDYVAWNWLAALHGAKATLYWCYLEEITGTEGGGYGLVRANGEITPRARSASETAKVLREYSHLLTGFLPTPQVGILYDPDNTMQLFAMEGADDLYIQSHVGYYRAVWRADLYARYVTYDSLEALNGLKVLIIPMCLTLTAKAAESITAFVAAGGVVIAEARTGLYDDRGFNQPVHPPYGLTEVVGAVEMEALYSDPDNDPPVNNRRGESWADPIYSGPEITFDGLSNQKFRTRGYFVPLEPTSGQPIAHSLGHCLAVRNSYGKGTAYYFGTYAGLALAQNDDGAAAVMHSLLRRHTTPEVTGVHLRPRWIDGADESLLLVFNDSRKETRRDTIRLPKPCARAFDICKKQDVVIQGQSLEFEVEPERASVILLQQE